MNWKRATAVLLSMVMAVTAAACGSTRQTQGGSSETGIADSQGTESAREESGQVPGLGILKGRVVRFSESELKVPHMGWNSVALTDPSDPIWKGMGKEPYFYFVHSYYPQPEDKSLIAAFCTYGVRFAVAVRRGNLVATQFHPEKSQKLGVKLLKNFISL